MSGQKIPRRMSVEEVMFAAHVDYTHNSQFIEIIDANHIVCLWLAVANADTCSRGIVSDGTIEKCITQ